MVVALRTTSTRLRADAQTSLALVDALIRATEDRPRVGAIVDR